MYRDMIKEIYNHLEDDISKKIFSNRLLYSLTGDKAYIRQILRELPEAGGFYDQITQEKLSCQGGVIFGAGSWGKELYAITTDYPWKCFVDNSPKAHSLEGIPVMPYADFIKDYQNEMIVISSRLYYKEMYQQLIDSGFAPEKIINAGALLDKWSRKQYFDLEALKPDEEEFFVDAGSLDGITSLEFADWCAESKKKFVYVFEPDKKNISKCYENLTSYDIGFEIIPKGCWSEETILRFQSQGNGNSAINPEGEESVEVTTLDSALKGKKVTFIKMDIEGSELNALYGAKDTIIKNRPKLAICIYHKPEDMWEIPSIILRYYPGYKLYIRHYSLTDSETVLYALP